MDFNPKEEHGNFGKWERADRLPRTLESNSAPYRAWGWGGVVFRFRTAGGAAFKELRVGGEGIGPGEIKV